MFFLFGVCRLYIQHYRESVISNAAFGKTTILEICGRGVSNYEMCPYVTNVADPQIRSYIAKLRIDCNKLADSKYRSFRFNIKSMTSVLYVKLGRLLHIGFYIAS